MGHHEHNCRQCPNGIPCDIPNDECNDIPNNGLCDECDAAERAYYRELRLREQFSAADWRTGP